MPQKLIPDFISGRLQQSSVLASNTEVQERNRRKVNLLRNCNVKTEKEICTVWQYYFSHQIHFLVHENGLNKIARNNNTLQQQGLIF